METPSKEPSRSLSLIDCTSLIIGSIIGVGIFEVIPTAAGLVSSAQSTLLLWAAGGLLSVAGALCYAELGTAYPRQGGDYYFLKRAFGPLTGFLFAWGSAVIIRPGSIAALALPAARYLKQMLAPGAAGGELELAVLLVAAVALLNMFGVRLNAWFQNTLTVLKITGLLLLSAAGFAAGSSPGGGAHAPVESNAWIALVLILFAYGGWSDVTLVAAEIKNVRRDLSKALVAGTVAVAAIYVLLNAAVFHALTIEGVRTTPAVASAIGERVLKSGFAASALVFLCAAGALHAFTFTGARVTAALGADYDALSVLGRWSERFGTPFAAIGLQGFISVLLLILIASFKGIIVYTTAAVWIFYTLTGLAVIVLRQRDRERVWRVPLYPLTPAVFSLSSLILVYQAVAYDFRGSLVCLAVLLAGVPVYRIARR